MRYDSFRELLEFSERRPGDLVPRRDGIAGWLGHGNSYHRYHGALLISRLASADKGEKLEKIIDEYLGLLEDESFIVAMNAASNLGRIARAKPRLRGKITKALLALDGTKHKHRDLLKSSAMLSFGEYFAESRDKKKILKFAKSLLGSGTSPKARKVAKDFLDKWGNDG